MHVIKIRNWNLPFIESAWSTARSKLINTATFRLMFLVLIWHLSHLSYHNSRDRQWQRQPLLREDISTGVWRSNGTLKNSFTAGIRNLTPTWATLCPLSLSFSLSSLIFNDWYPITTRGLSGHCLERGYAFLIAITNTQFGTPAVSRGDTKMVTFVDNFIRKSWWRRHLKDVIIFWRRTGWNKGGFRSAGSVCDWLWFSGIINKCNSWVNFIYI